MIGKLLFGGGEGSKKAAGLAQVSSFSSSSITSKLPNLSISSPGKEIYSMKSWLRKRCYSTRAPEEGSARVGNTHNQKKNGVGDHNGNSVINNIGNTTSRSSNRLTTDMFGSSNSVNISKAMKRSNRNVAMYSVAALVAVGGLSYAAVPLYKMYCSATGYAGTTKVTGTQIGSIGS